jgi:hypothetical protein
MKLETVNELILKQKPTRITIYLRDKLLFKGDVKYFNTSTVLGELYVYTYEYINKNKNNLLIRVIEQIKR